MQSEIKGKHIALVSPPHPEGGGLLTEPLIIAVYLSGIPARPLLQLLDSGHHGRAILGEQKMALIFQAFNPAWSNVVFPWFAAGSSAFGLLVNPFRILRPSLSAF
jgi:hypothetical protein